MNFNFTELMQATMNESGHDATAAAAADTGGNSIMGGLLSLNALNPATSTAAGVNLSPITQANVGSDIDSILDADVFADLL